jgi:hypothetical protein
VKAPESILFKFRSSFAGCAAGCACIFSSTGAASFAFAAFVSTGFDFFQKANDMVSKNDCKKKKSYGSDER